MPKKQLFLSILILVILCLICMFIYNHYKVEKEIQLVISEKEACQGNLDLYYTDSSGNRYYLYCLDNIKVDYQDRILELNKALEAKQVTMDFVTSQLKKDSTSKEVTIMRNSSFSLLQCHTEEGNHDYYFGPSNMEQREGFCKEEPYSCSFVKNYLVLDVSESNDFQYRYLTLREYQGEEVVTVKVKREFIEEIEEDHYYAFQFGATGKSLEEDIQSLIYYYRLRK